MGRSSSVRWIRLLTRANVHWPILIWFQPRLFNCDQARYLQTPIVYFSFVSFKHALRFNKPNSFPHCCWFEEQSGREIFSHIPAIATSHVSFLIRVIKCLRPSSVLHKRTREKKPLPSTASHFLLHRYQSSGMPDDIKRGNMSELLNQKRDFLFNRERIWMFPMCRFQRHFCISTPSSVRHNLPLNFWLKCSFTENQPIFSPVLLTHHDDAKKSSCSRMINVIFTSWNFPTNVTRYEVGRYQLSNGSHSRYINVFTKYTLNLFFAWMRWWLFRCSQHRPCLQQCYGRPGQFYGFNETILMILERAILRAL